MKENVIRYGSLSPNYRLILLHGWGADAEDLVPLGQKLIDDNPVKLEIVSLRAPELHPEGIGRQWYGLFPPNWSAVPNAVNKLQKQIESLTTPEVSLDQTIILGFSQGGAMALAISSEISLKAVIACSGYPHPGWTPSPTNNPTLLTHGNLDEVVPAEASKQIFEKLKYKNNNIEICLFEGGHEIPNLIIERIKLFITQNTQN